MGTITKGKHAPELEKELFLLAPGEYSQNIVKTRWGHHILKVDEIVTDKYYPYEEVKERVEAAVKVQKEAKLFEEMVGELQKDAEIEIYEDRM